MSDTQKQVQIQVDVDQQVRDALTRTDLQDIHFNGFISAVGSGDVLLVLKRHEQLVAKLSMSFTVAKTLAQKLAGVIKQLEDATGNTIMTTDDIQEAQKQNEQSAPSNN